MSRVPSRSSAIPGLRDAERAGRERIRKVTGISAPFERGASSRATSPNVRRSSGAARPARSTASGTRSSKAHSQELGLRSKLKRVEHHLQSRGERLLHERLRRSVDRDARRLRVRAGRQRQRRPQRVDRTACTAWSTRTRWERSTSRSPPDWGFKPSRHEGKIVGLAAYGDPAVLRDVLLARFEIGAREFPHPREQQPLLRADAGHAVPED